MTVPARPAGRRRLATIALLAVLTAGGYMGWQGIGGRVREAPAPPSYVAATPSTYRLSVPAPGTLKAADRTDVRTATSGTVAYVTPVGTRVTAGEVVARLETTALERSEREASLALDRARRTLEAARSDLTEAERQSTGTVEQAERRVADALAHEVEARRTLELSERLAAVGAETPNALARAREDVQDATVALEEAKRELADSLDARTARLERSVNDLANALDAVEQAELALLRAQEDLSAAEVTSRIAGIVERVDAPAGTSLNANGLIASVVDDSRLHLIAQVDETEVGQVATGQQAEISVVAASGLALPGEVIAVAPTAQVTQNIPVFEVTVLVDNTDLRLRPGMTAEAEIVLREVEGTVTVPTRALIRGAATAAFAGAATAETAAHLREGAAARFRDGIPADVTVRLREEEDGAGGFAAGAPAAGADRFRGAAPAEGTAPASDVGGSLAAVRVRIDGEITLLPVEVVATVGANSVLRAEFPAGAEIEVPASTSAGTSAGTPQGGGLFNFPGASPGGAVRFAVPDRRP